MPKNGIWHNCFTFWQIGGLIWGQRPKMLLWMCKNAFDSEFVYKKILWFGIFKNSFDWECVKMSFDLEYVKIPLILNVFGICKCALDSEWIWYGIFKNAFDLECWKKSLNLEYAKILLIWNVKKRLDSSCRKCFWSECVQMSLKG